MGVVFLSRLHGPEGVDGGAGRGAAYYLPKSCAVDQLAEAIRHAYAGERPVFGEGLDRLLHDLEERRHAAHRAARRLAELTPRELDVLEWLAAGATAESIAEKLGASPQTIQTHIRNLKAKTGAHVAGGGAHGPGQGGGVLARRRAAVVRGGRQAGRRVDGG